MAEKTREHPLVIAIVGPTCSGKTALSIDLAKKIGGEIVACDSRTIYTYMDVGTAKPSSEEQAAVPHHMLDVVEPSEVFTVAQYKEKAQLAMDGIIERGRVPIVCGGTGFYARALLEGLVIPSVAPQPEMRAQFRELAEREGNLALYKRLEAIDSATAAKLNQNDVFRVVRALEVSLVAGKPFSELTKREAVPYDIIWMGLNASDRAILKTYIRMRLHIQMQSGLQQEVEQLYQKYGACHTLMNTVNYREFIDSIDSRISAEQAFEDCVLHNNQLARRQLIWFRANKSIEWLNIDQFSKEQLLERSLQMLPKGAF